MAMQNEAPTVAAQQCGACVEAWGEPDVCTCPPAEHRALSTVTPAEVGGLVEKLRQCAVDPMWADHAEVPKQWLSEAATALEAKEAELAAIRGRHPNPADFRYWEGRYRDEKAENERLSAALAEARKALEPLKKLADAVFYVDEDGREMNAGKPDDASIWGFDGAELTYGHLRSARRALTGGQEDG